QSTATSSALTCPIAASSTPQSPPMVIAGPVLRDRASLSRSRTVTIDEQRATPQPCSSPASPGTSIRVVEEGGRSRLMARAPSATRMARDEAEPCHWGTTKKEAGTAPVCHAAPASQQSLARGHGLRPGATGLQGGEACLQLDLLARVLELLELRVEAGRGELLAAEHARLLAAHLLLEAADLARGVEQVDALHGVHDLGLRLRGLGAGDQLAALRRELAELPAHGIEPALELVDDGRLVGDDRFGIGGLLLGGHLLAEGDLG